jgi:hypothetical protein
VALAPLQSPVAEHDEALVELQVRFEVFPWTIAAGLAEIASVGGGVAGATFTVTDCDAEPPLPEQVSV